MSRLRPVLGLATFVTRLLRFVARRPTPAQSAARWPRSHPVPDVI